MTRSSAPGLVSRERGAALAHAVANDFAAAERDLVAVDGEVFLDFDDQFGVGQANAVACGGPVEIGVGAAGNLEGHFNSSSNRADRSVESALESLEPLDWNPSLCARSIARFCKEESDIAPPTKPLPP